MTGKGKTLCVAPIHSSFSNDDIDDLTRQLGQRRRQNESDVIVCNISGFDNDPRELGEIPEARALCRRLVSRGFISWLEVSTTVPLLRRPDLDTPAMSAALGALEVWLIAEGLVGKAGTHQIAPADLLRFQAVLAEANQKADELPE